MMTAPEKRLAQQAYEKILNSILSGQAEPGELINERRLAETLEMSRTPVRDALLMLESEGLLVRQGARGLQVKQMRVEDYMEALQVRLLLEPEIARRASGRLPVGDARALAEDFQKLIDDEAAGAPPPDRLVVRGVDDRLHGTMADAAGNTQLAQIVRSLRRQTQIFDLRSMPERLTGTCREHLEILNAARAGEGERAAEAMRQHLENVRISIISRLSWGMG